ncbi:MAG: FAD-binding oxidoreductase [Anaerolineae bacterium]|nr:FAD-binding oxidoreductase [Anaerolineae bacterium]
MQSQPVGEAEIAALAAGLDGDLLRAGEADYDSARAVWNGMIDRHPALIVRCRSAQDVQRAVRFASAHSLRLSVRGSGHNVAGTAVNDDGLVIDLSQMKQIQVDAQARTARAQPGVNWGELDRATQAYGLATPGGVVSDTGIAGLTLGGGLGWLRNKYGLSCDNLISVEIVTADGQLITASADEHPDLYWALRGGGGAFGIVTTFEYQLHPVGPDVFVAFCFHDGNNARELLRFYRDFIATAPDEISTFAVLAHIPASEHFPAEHHGQLTLLFQACYAGDVADGERALQPLRDVATPLIDMSSAMPFVELQTLWDEEYPRGDLRYYWRSTYLKALSDEAINRLVALIAEAPSPLTTLDIWAMGGALSRVAPDATAFAHRDAAITIGVESNWADPADDEVNMTWARHVTQALEPFSTGGQYLNFPGFFDEGEATLRQVYGVNYDRVMAVKAQYDPQHLFPMK